MIVWQWDKLGSKNHFVLIVVTVCDFTYIAGLPGVDYIALNLKQVVRYIRIDFNHEHAYFGAHIDFACSLHRRVDGDEPEGSWIFWLLQVIHLDANRNMLEECLV